jgi:hypothetical protein
MRKIPKYKLNGWSTPRLHFLIKKRYKNNFRERITTPEINKIWNSYIEEEILSNLKIGAIVKLDKQTKIWVKATPIIKHKRAMSLLTNGFMYVGGRVKEANMRFDSSKYIYKIMLETDRYKDKLQLFFKPHKNLSNVVSEGIKQGKLITRLQCQ